MSGASSSAVEWYTRLEPAKAPADLPHRPDDPRLGQVVEFWRGDPAALRPGRAVLIGFPQDEGVRRNGGRVGAADAPDEIRYWVYRLTLGDPASDRDLVATPPLDMGDVRIIGDLEDTQAALADVVAGVLGYGAIPIVLGGGHETAFGVFLGYVAAGRAVGIINIDAHLDVRPLIGGLGHSGSPFRQALDHEPPLARYVCMGVQPHVTSREHLRYVLAHGGRVRWHREVELWLATYLAGEVQRLNNDGLSVHVTIDADVVRQADVPGVSAPNSNGIEGRWLIDAARIAGLSPQVAGLDLVEINPRHDRDGQSARWGALIVWNFLVGLLDRS